MKNLYFRLESSSFGVVQIGININFSILLIKLIFPLPDFNKENETRQINET